MAFVYADFVSAFPEFADTDVYPAGTFFFWQGVANLRLNVRRWGDLLDHGAMLFVAHNMAEQGRALQVAAAGGLGLGEARGPVASKSIDKISYAFNTDAVTVEEAGDYNSTQYGIKFYQLAQIIGSGGMQL